MHSTVAYIAQTPSQRARNQSVRSAWSRTAPRNAIREVADVPGVKSMILVFIFTPLKIGFIGSTRRCGGKLQKERSREPESRRQEGQSGVKGERWGWLLLGACLASSVVPRLRDYEGKDKSRGRSVGPGRARLPKDPAVLPKATPSTGSLRVLTSRRWPSRGSIASARCMGCHTLDHGSANF